METNKMKIIFRALLFPFAGLYEIFLLIIVLISTVVVVASDYVNKYSVMLAENMLDRSKKLPSIPWYIGK